MNDEELNKLYETVANGITALYEQSEARGDDASLNRARVLFLALSGYLSEHGILEALALYAKFANEPGSFPKFIPEQLPMI